MSAAYRAGPHESGQNFLTDPAVIRTVQRLVARTSGPIVELGGGRGALTVPLSRLRRPVTAVELDGTLVDRLRRRVPDNVTIRNEDMLQIGFPRHPHVLVGNLPFHLTTSVLRRVFTEQYWQCAVLLMQWETARRRAGVGGATLLTASWWPWYEFTLHERVPARCFRPVPGVDGGLLTITRSSRLADADRLRYQRFVKAVFTGRGRGIREILARTGRVEDTAAAGWLHRRGISPRALPKDLRAADWIALWDLVSGKHVPDRRC